MSKLKRALTIRNVVAASAIAVAGIGLVSASPAEALDRCKVKIDQRTGTILVDASDITGNLRWGYTATNETNSFSDPGCIDPSRGRAKKCTLGNEGTPERINPPPLCTLYLADDAGSCSAYIKKCTPGVRQGGENISDGNGSVEHSVPYVQTGSISNDSFLRFLGGKEMTEAQMIERCGDADGCRITLTRTYGSSRTVYGPIQFSYDPSSKDFWVLGSGGGVTGTNDDGPTTAILGPTGNTNCYFSDWDSAGGVSTGDQDGNFTVIVFNSTSTPLICALRVDD